MAMTLQEARERYGPDAVISGKGDYILVHLDRPSLATLEHRTATFNPEVHFDDACALCREQQQRRVVIFGDGDQWRQRED